MNRLLVMPFDNVSHEGRLYWLSEASAVLLTDDLNAMGTPAITRDQRIGAFERLHVPPVATLSHATVIRLGQLVGASHVVMGAFEQRDGRLIVRAREIRLDSGRMHPEMGHIRIPRHPSDGFGGACPWHGDCLEGLASGTAMRERWGRPGEELPAEHPAWALECHYLALGLVSFLCTLSPRRIIVGGGVPQRLDFDALRAEVRRLLNGYLAEPEIVPPGLTGNAGVLGAMALAGEALP